MKNILILIILTASNLFSQDNFFAEVKQTKSGDVKLVNGQGEIATKIYIKKDKKFVESTGIEIGTQQTLTEGEKVTFVDNKDCYTDTKTLIREYDSDVNFKKLKQEPTDQTDEIAGYECKKTIITFKRGLFNFEAVVWFTDKVDKKFWGTTILTDMVAGHEFHKMLESIEGIILKYEVTANMTGQKMTTEATSINFDPVNDGVFKINKKSCKEMMTFKDYQKLLEKRRQKEAQQNHNMGR